MISEAQKIYYLSNQVLRNLGFVDDNGYTKAVDPLEPESILLEEKKTVKNIIEKNSKQDAKTVKQLNKIVSDIDYDSEESINSAIKKTDKVIKNHGKLVAPQASGILEDDSEVYYKKVSNKLATDFGTASSFIQADEELIKIINNWNETFIGDNYRNNVTNQVNNIIRDTIKRDGGAMSRGQLTSELTSRMKRTVRNENYWNTVASSVLNNSRSASSLRFYDGAGISKYEVLSVLDEITSNICRNMHGRIFSVSNGLKAYEKLSNAETAEEAKDVMPWMSTNKEEEVLLRGSDIRTLSNAELQAKGVSTPPYHGKCRTTIVPILV